MVRFAGVGGGLGLKRVQTNELQKQDLLRYVRLQAARSSDESCGESRTTLSNYIVSRQQLCSRQRRRRATSIGVESPAV